MSYAICVTGHLARLELESKLDYLVVPQLVLGCEVQVFVSANSAETVEKFHSKHYFKSSISDEVHANGTVDWQAYMGKNNWDVIRENDDNYSDSIDFENMQHYRVMTNNQGQSFGFHVDFYNMHSVYGIDAKLRIGSSRRNRSKGKDILVEWSGLHRLMDIIDAYESKVGAHFDAVARLGESVHVLDSVALPRLFDRQLKTLKWQENGGLNDRVYLLGRGGANCFLRSFYHEYFHDHQSLQNLFRFDKEKVAYAHAGTCRMALSTLQNCELPALDMHRKPDGQLCFTRDTFTTLNLNNKYNEVFSQCPKTLAIVSRTVEAQRNVSVDTFSEKNDDDF